MGSAPDVRFRVTAWPGYPVTPPAVQVREVTVEGEWLRFSPATTGLPFVTVPVEIRLRELADLDVTDVEAIADFVGTYGRMTPLWSLTSDLPLGNDNPDVAYIRLLAETASRNGRTSPLDLEQVAEGPRHKGLRPFDLVHADDVAVRVRVLRQLTRHAIAHAAGDYERDVWPDCADEAEAWDRFTRFANAALSEFHVRVYVDRGHPEANIGAPQPSVYQVAVLQLVNDLAADVDYNTCPAEGCGRIFIRSRGATSKAFNRTKGVTYCSPYCSNAQRQREFRRRKRESNT